jgi:hypothetical protein
MASGTTPQRGEQKVRKRFCSFKGGAKALRQVDVTANRWYFRRSKRLSREQSKSDDEEPKLIVPRGSLGVSI